METMEYVSGRKNEDVVKDKMIINCVEQGDGIKCEICGSVQRVAEAYATLLGAASEDEDITEAFTLGVALHMDRMDKVNKEEGEETVE